MTSKMREIENYITRPKGLYKALCELYGCDPKCRPEDIVEAAWKAVPKYRERSDGHDDESEFR